MTARKINNAWWVDFQWQHVTGTRGVSRERVRRRSPIQNKRGAEEYERHLRQRLSDGRSIDASDEPAIPTFADFAAEFMRTYAAANNKASELDTKRCILEAHFLPRFGRRRLDEVTLRDVETFRGELKAATLSAKRINNVVGCLMRVLRYAEEIELLSSVPKVKPLRVPVPKFDFFDFDEYARFVAAASADPERRVMALLAGDAGLRKGEIAALEWGDVDLDGRRLTIRRNAWYKHSREHVDTPKGGRERTVEMTDRLVRSLRSHRHLRGPRVLTNAEGGGLRPASLEYAVRAICQRAGLRQVGWHALRHTFCSHLAMSGADARTIQEFAGHSTLTMTMRYMHLAPSHKRGAITQLERSHGQLGLNHLTTGGESQSSLGI